MYFGEAQSVLDDKNRITVSRKFRETMDVLGHVIWYMTRGFDGSVFIFPKEEWDKIRTQAARRSSMDGRAIDFRRMFFGSVEEVRPDKQGRMLVPQHLREYAQLEKEVVLLGVDDHLELWSKDRWRAYQDTQESEYKAIAGELFMPSGEQTADANGGAS